MGSLPSSIEGALKKALQSFERACDNISHSISIVGYAAAAYFVMTGISRIIEARNKRLPPPLQDEEKMKKNKRKRDKKKQSKNDHVNEEWEETQEWEKELEENPSLLDHIP